MCALSVRRIEGQVIWHDAVLLPEIGPEFFDPAWHLARGTAVGSAPGRGQAIFLDWKGRALVLRPFRRGGLVGRLVAGSYLRLGADRSRAFREYELLAWLRAQGLPVPCPVAARYAPKGLIYRADLVTERIDGARTLADWLRKGSLPAAVWASIGGVIGRMHRLGVDHTDLNCRNILLDAGLQPWLIDFDKCRRRPLGAWRKSNLKRLKRSLVKEQARVPGLAWNAEDWTALEDGYRTGAEFAEARKRKAT